MLRIRLVLTWLLVCLLAVPGWGADRYANSINGSNAYSGNSTHPWRDLSYADDMAVAGDTVYGTAPATAPFRDIFYPANSGSSGNLITYRSTAAGTKFYVSGMTDVTNGSTIPDFLYWGDFESWLNATTPHEYVITRNGSEFEREATTVRSGTYSLRGKKTASTGTMSTTFELPQGANCTLTAWHNQAFANKRYKLRLTDNTSGDHLLSNGTWGATATFYHNEGTVGAWNSTAVSFTVQNTGDHFFSMSWPDSGQNVYADDVTVALDNPTCVWAQHSGDTWKLVSMVPSPRILATASNTQWTAQGVEALVYATKSANLTDCVNTAGEWWYESGVLYYHLDSGETIANTHIEVSTERYRGNTSQQDSLDIATNYISVQDAYAVGAYNNNFDLSGNPVYVNRVVSYIPYAFGLQVDAGVCNGTDINSTYALTQDCINVAGGTGNLHKVRSSYAWDEGIESSGSGQLNIDRFVIEYAGQNGNPGSEGLVAINTSGITAKHGTIVHSAGAGFGTYTSGPVRLYNFASFSNGFNDVRAENGSSDIEVYNCAWENSYDFWDTYVNATSSNSTVTSTPGFVDIDNGNYALLETSNLKDAGVDAGVISDIIGISMPQGSGYPIGAYEYVPSVAELEVLKKKIITVVPSKMQSKVQ